MQHRLYSLCTRQATQREEVLAIARHKRRAFTLGLGRPRAIDAACRMYWVGFAEDMREVVDALVATLFTIARTEQGIQEMQR
jgi:hypothetical protein